MKQLTLAAADFERYAKTTRRAVFLAEMQRVVPWPALCGLIEPFYPKAGNGRPPRRLGVAFQTRRRQRHLLHRPQPMRANSPRRRLYHDHWPMAFAEVP